MIFVAMAEHEVFSPRAMASNRARESRAIHVNWPSGSERTRVLVALAAAPVAAAESPLAKSIAVSLRRVPYELSSCSEGTFDVYIGASLADLRAHAAIAVSP